MANEKLDLIDRGALMAQFDDSFKGFVMKRIIEMQPKVDAVPVVDGYKPGDVCFYGCAGENTSRALVEIVKILNDERGCAEVKFLKVFVDDTGNGMFNYLLKSGKTMNASFKYLKNITPNFEEVNK